MYSNSEWLLNPFPNKPWFLRVCSTCLLKTLREKEKLLVTSNFSFSHSVFYSFEWTFCQFHHIWNCCLQTLSVWKSLKFVVRERVKFCCSSPPSHPPKKLFWKIQYNNRTGQHTRYSILTSAPAAVMNFCFSEVLEWAYYLICLNYGRY